MKYIIDAKGKKIGRIASDAAAHLMGKHSALFAKNKVTEDQVEICNAKLADVGAKKLVSDKYVTYTGHRGGLKSESLAELISRRGAKEVFYRAILRMLPANKLRDLRMKNLIIKE
jgi:large subunit ribosomal protein L13